MYCELLSKHPVNKPQPQKTIDQGAKQDENSVYGIVATNKLPGEVGISVGQKKKGACKYATPQVNLLIILPSWG